MSQVANHNPFVAALIAKVDYLEDQVSMYEMETARLRAERDMLAARLRVVLTPRTTQENLCPTK
jgi:hypothetical protein